MRAALLAWLIFILSNGPALAQDVVPVKEGDPAPFSGLLVKEARFTKMLEAELSVEELSGKLKIQEGLTSKLELIYSTKLEEAVKPLPWYQGPEFNKWLGFFLGVAVTSLAIWGGSELVKAVK